MSILHFYTLASNREKIIAVCQLPYLFHYRFDAFYLFALYIIQYAAQLRSGNGSISITVININLSDFSRLQPTLLAKEA